MIVDTLENINQYKSLSENIYKGLKFLAEADPGIALGTHVIAKNVSATGGHGKDADISDLEQRDVILGAIREASLVVAKDLAENIIKSSTKNLANSYNMTQILNVILKQ